MVEAGCSNLEPDKEIARSRRTVSFLKIEIGRDRSLLQGNPVPRLPDNLVGTEAHRAAHFVQRAAQGPARIVIGPPRPEEFGQVIPGGTSVSGTRQIDEEREGFMCREADRRAVRIKHPRSITEPEKDAWAAI